MHVHLALAVRRGAFVAILIASHSDFAQSEPPNSVPSIEALETEVNALHENPTRENVAAATQKVAAWIESQNDPQLDGLSDMQLVWLMSRLTYHKLDTPEGFTVSWKGRLQAPRSGRYRFSVSPININSDADPTGVFRQSITVTLRGQQVLNAGNDAGEGYRPAGWAHRGVEVELEAEESAPIEIAYRYEFKGENQYVLKAPAVTLYWQGPGLSQSVVPPSALRLQDGSARGLAAAYARKTGQTYEAIGEVVEPLIDHAWIHKHNFYCAHLAAQEKVQVRFWTRMIDPTYLDACEVRRGNEPSQHLLFQRSYLASYLAAAQRAEFLRVVASRPALLATLSESDAAALYVRFRYGAEDAALDFLGNWMHIHPDVQPQLANSFFAANRARYRSLAVQIGLQDSRLIDVLQKDYLQSADGRCSLPAAQTLAYAYLVTGRMWQWVELLDEKLADESLAGDQRVNWLIARSMAEEVGGSPANRHQRGGERILAGRKWLEEASTVAESESSRVRALGELIAREGALGLSEQAIQRLDEQSGDVSGDAARQSIAAWRSEMALIAARRAEQRAADVQVGLDAHVAELQRRSEQATLSGDASSAERYRLLLEGSQQDR